MKVLANILTTKIQNSAGNSDNYSSSTPNTIMMALGEGITEFIMDHIRFNVNFSGMIPGTPPVPDMCADVVKPIGKCLPISGADFSSWCLSIGEGIKGGFMFGTGNAGVISTAPTPCFQTHPPLIIDQESLSSIVSSEDDPFMPVWDKITDKIVEWLLAGPPTAVYSASHGPAVGVTTVLKTITI